MPVGTFVGYVVVSDQDANDATPMPAGKLRFVLGSVSSGPPPFSISSMGERIAGTDRTRLLLVTTRALNFESMSSYVVPVVVRDSSGATYTAQQRILVTDFNDIPKMISVAPPGDASADGCWMVREDVEVFTFVGNVTAEDEDEDEIGRAHV